MWRYRRPIQSDYSTDEDYEDAVVAYDAAESQYEDECRERYYEQKYNE